MIVLLNLGIGKITLGTKGNGEQGQMACHKALITHDMGVVSQGVADPDQTSKEQHAVDAQ